jgi:hypothetical protein
MSCDTFRQDYGRWSSTETYAKILEAMVEAFARLVQETDWEDELQENTANVLPGLDVQIPEQGVQQLMEDFGCSARACGHTDDYDGPYRCLRSLRLRQSALVHHGDLGPSSHEAGVILGIFCKVLAVGSLALENRQTSACNPEMALDGVARNGETAQRCACR